MSPGKHSGPRIRCERCNKMVYVLTYQPVMVDGLVELLACCTTCVKEVRDASQAMALPVQRDQVRPHAAVVVARTQVRTPWAVVCRKHERVYLTVKEYDAQMRAADSLWTCPICGQPSVWDDENYERHL